MSFKIFLESAWILALAILSIVRIFTTTPIAKLIFTSACHMVTSLFLFNPEVALGTLLVFGTSHELFKLFISVRKRIVDLVLCTSHTCMPFATTSYTVNFCANWTIELNWVTLLIDEHVATVRRWTPWDIWTCLTIELHLSLSVMCNVSIVIKHSFNIWLVHIDLALRIWTNYWEFVIINGSFNSEFEAIGTKYMVAIFQDRDPDIVTEGHHANLATLRLFLLLLSLFNFISLLIHEFFFELHGQSETLRFL